MRQGDRAARGAERRAAFTKSSIECVSKVEFERGETRGNPPQNIETPSEIQSQGKFFTQQSLYAH